MTSAHTIVAQASLGILLGLDENITRDGLEELPLVKYAAEHWVGHAQFENVSSNVQDGMKRLFDPSHGHLSAWVWISDPEMPQPRSERPAKSRATPLHYAAACGLYDVAMFLIVEHSQDVNARGFDDKKAPLHVALSRRHVHVAQLLLEHGADTKAEDSNKRNPLHLASKNGLVEIARFVLECGIDTEAREDIGDWSPLEWASAMGHVELIRLLLEHGADAKARDKDNVTPMHVASSYGQLGFGVGRVLLEHGADVKAQDNDNKTPLHWARGKEVTRFLLEHGADANVLDIKNRTPLHHASEKGEVGVVRVLLEHGVDANARDDHNMTPTHLASGSDVDDEEHLDVVRLLLQYGSDIHALDNEGHTPFMGATEEGNQRIMQLLLDNGAEDHRK